MRFILILLIIFTIPIYALAESCNDREATSSIDKKDLLALQQQITSLKEQISQVKKSKNINRSNSSLSFATYGSKIDNTSITSGHHLDLAINELNNADAADITSAIEADDSIDDDMNNNGVFISNGKIDVGGTPAITTQGQITYLGSYSGNNSIPIGMISSNLFASTILEQRDSFNDYSVFFGGYIEADAQAWFGSQINRTAGAANFQSTGQNIYLTNSKLYFLSNLGHYVTAQFDFDTDETGSFGIGNAFVIFGNLDTSPFFMTAGRSKLSVGSYGGGPWTSGIIDDFLSPDKVTNVSINYKDDKINTNITIFGSDDNRANFSAGFFYTDSWTQDLSVGFNAGYVFNIAGAGNSSISQFLDSTGRANDNVGVINFDGTLAYLVLGSIAQLQGGWSTTTNTEDFNQNGTNVNASPNFGLASSGIKNQWIISAQRAYFDNNVLLGPKYSYQRLYNNQYMNTLTLDLSASISISMMALID